MHTGLCLMNYSPPSCGEVSPKVNPLMLTHVGAVPEGLPTLTALVGLLSSVDDGMSNEVRAPTKGLPAVTAHKRLLPSVDALVPLEV
jgi:hypothetical protein